MAESGVLRTRSASLDQDLAELLHEGKKALSLLPSNEAVELVDSLRTSESPLALALQDEVAMAGSDPVSQQLRRPASAPANPQRRASQLGPQPPSGNAPKGFKRYRPSTAGLQRVEKFDTVQEHLEALKDEEDIRSWGAKQMDDAPSAAPKDAEDETFANLSDPYVSDSHTANPCPPPMESSDPLPREQMLSSDLFVKEPITPQPPSLLGAEEENSRIERLSDHFGLNEPNDPDHLQRSTSKGRSTLPKPLPLSPTTTYQGDQGPTEVTIQDDSVPETLGPLLLKGASFKIKDAATMMRAARIHKNSQNLLNKIKEAKEQRRKMEEEAQAALEAEEIEAKQIRVRLEQMENDGYKEVIEFLWGELESSTTAQQPREQSASNLPSEDIEVQWSQVSEGGNRSQSQGQWPAPALDIDDSMVDDTFTVKDLVSPARPSSNSSFSQSQRMKMLDIEDDFRGSALSWTVGGESPKSVGLVSPFGQPRAIEPRVEAEQTQDVQQRLVSLDSNSSVRSNRQNNQRSDNKTQSPPKASDEPDEITVSRRTAAEQRVWKTYIRVRKELQKPYEPPWRTRKRLLRIRRTASDERATAAAEQLLRIEEQTMKSRAEHLTLSPLHPLDPYYRLNSPAGKPTSISGIAATDKSHPQCHEDCPSSPFAGDSLGQDPRAHRIPRIIADEFERKKMEVQGLDIGEAKTQEEQSTVSVDRIPSWIVPRVVGGNDVKAIQNVLKNVFSNAAEAFIFLDMHRMGRITKEMLKCRLEVLGMLCKPEYARGVDITMVFIEARSDAFIDYRTFWKYFAWHKRSAPQKAFKAAQLNRLVVYSKGNEYGRVVVRKRRSTKRHGLFKVKQDNHKSFVRSNANPFIFKYLSRTRKLDFDGQDKSKILRRHFDPYVKPLIPIFQRFFRTVAEAFVYINIHFNLFGITCYDLKCAFLRLKLPATFSVSYRGIWEAAGCLSETGYMSWIQFRRLFRWHKVTADPDGEIAECFARKEALNARVTRQVVDVQRMLRWQERANRLRAERDLKLEGRSQAPRKTVAARIRRLVSEVEEHFESASSSDSSGSLQVAHIKCSQLRSEFSKIGILYRIPAWVLGLAPQELNLQDLIGLLQSEKGKILQLLESALAGAQPLSLQSLAEDPLDHPETSSPSNPQPSFTFVTSSARMLTQVPTTWYPPLPSKEMTDLQKRGRELLAQQNQQHSQELARQLGGQSAEQLRDLVFHWKAARGGYFPFKPLTHVFKKEMFHGYLIQRPRHPRRPASGQNFSRRKGPPVFNIMLAAWQINRNAECDQPDAFQRTPTNNKSTKSKQKMRQYKFRKENFDAKDEIHSPIEERSKPTSGSNSATPPQARRRRPVARSRSIYFLPNPFIPKSRVHEMADLEADKEIRKLIRDPHPEEVDIHPTYYQLGASIARVPAVIGYGEESISEMLKCEMTRKEPVLEPTNMKMHFEMQFGKLSRECMAMQPQADGLAINRIASQKNFPWMKHASPSDWRQIQKQAMEQSELNRPVEKLKAILPHQGWTVKKEEMKKKEKIGETKTQLMREAISQRRRAQEIEDQRAFEQYLNDALPQAVSPYETAKTLDINMAASSPTSGKLSSVASPLASRMANSFKSRDSTQVHSQASSPQAQHKPNILHTHRLQAKLVLLSPTGSPKGSSRRKLQEGSETLVSSWKDGAIAHPSQLVSSSAIQSSPSSIRRLVSDPDEKANIDAPKGASSQANRRTSESSISFQVESVSDARPAGKQEAGVKWHKAQFIQPAIRLLTSHHHASKIESQQVRSGAEANIKSIPRPQPKIGETEKLLLSWTGGGTRTSALGTEADRYSPIQRTESGGTQRYSPIDPEEEIKLMANRLHQLKHLALIRNLKKERDLFLEKALGARRMESGTTYEDLRSLRGELSQMRQELNRVL